MQLKYKSKVNGEVVYSEGFIKFSSGIIVVPTRIESDGVMETSPIDEESLCVFTGVKDMNKTDIYENDYLTDGKLIFKVEYNTQNTGFYIRPISDDILDSISYEKLGNGYYSRRDLVLIKR